MFIARTTLRTRIAAAAALAALPLTAPFAGATGLSAGSPPPAADPTPLVWVRPSHMVTAKPLPRRPTHVVVTATSGFDWDAALLGAALTGGLIAMAGGGLLVLRRSRADVTPPIGAQ